MLIQCVAAIVAHGQNSVAERAIYPEKLHEDIEVLRSFLHEAHPDPYRRHTPDELDRIIGRVRDSVVIPLVSEEFLDAVMPVFHAIGDPRCAPEQVLSNDHEWIADAALIPLRLRVIGGRLHVEEELKGFRSLPPGARILSINGHTDTRIMERLRALIISEGSNETYRDRRIGAEFPMLYHRHLDRAGSFLVRYEDPEGMVQEQSIVGMTMEEMARTRRPQGATVAPWSVEHVPGTGACWFTLSTFERDTLTRAGQRPEKFLENLCRELRRSRTQVLIVDVRGASGRELAMAEVVFSALADAPFRVVQDMSVRSLVPPRHYHLAVPQPGFYASVAEQFQPDGAGRAHLRADDERLQPVPPAAKAFQGKVYVVCDGLTRDAGAAFVMLAKRTRRARIIGEEVGTNAASFTGGRELQVTLPNSGMRFRVPLIRYVPEGTPTGPADRGERPHHELEQQPWGLARGRDAVRESVLQLLQELR